MTARELNDEEWGIEPGTELRRREVHYRYGGNWQSGIAPLKRSVNILVFSGSSGAKYGYDYDGWHAGTFHYTGEGRVGDQKRASVGNRALAQPGRRIRLFEDGKKATYVRYVGEFMLGTGDSAIYEGRAPDEDGNDREVIVFELWPVDTAAAVSENAELDKPAEQVVPVEAHRADKFAVNPRKGPTVAERREAQLVKRFMDWLDGQGHEVAGRHIRRPKQRSWAVDLFDEKLKELIEAKADASRENVRYALGQLQDYRRHVEHEGAAVLLPEKPEVDLVDLLTSNGISVIYEADPGSFARIEVSGSSEHG